MVKKHQQPKDFNPEAIKWLLPEYPRISHLPFKTNATEDDFVADKKVLEKLVDEKLCIQEKIDGASCGMAIYDNIGYIRNRKHILNKAYTKIKTPAKEQFLSTWNWLYEHRKNFQELNKYFGEEVSVYGDWCLYQHGTIYDALPDKFICYDVYVPSKKSFAEASEAIDLLREFGFNTTKVIKRDFIGSIDKLHAYTTLPSAFSKSGATTEGIVIRFGNTRYKMVNVDYVSNRYWSERQGNLQPCWIKT